MGTGNLPPLGDEVKTITKQEINDERRILNGDILPRSENGIANDNIQNIGSPTNRVANIYLGGRIIQTGGAEEGTIGGFGNPFGSILAYRVSGVAADSYIRSGTNFLTYDGTNVSVGGSLQSPLVVDFQDGSVTSTEKQRIPLTLTPSLDAIRFGTAQYRPTEAAIGRTVWMRRDGSIYVHTPPISYRGFGHSVYPVFWVQGAAYNTSRDADELGFGLPRTHSHALNPNGPPNGVRIYNQPNLSWEAYNSSTSDWEKLSDCLLGYVRADLSSNPANSPIRYFVRESATLVGVAEALRAGTPLSNALGAGLWTRTLTRMSRGTVVRWFYDPITGAGELFHPPSPVIGNDNLANAQIFTTV